MTHPKNFITALAGLLVAYLSLVSANHQPNGPPAGSADPNRAPRASYENQSEALYNPPPAQAQAQVQTQNGKHANTIHKCTRQSVILARQMLTHELQHINQFGPQIWFADLDREELQEGQRHSLSNIVMSGAGTSLLNPNGQPLLEIESSYFRGRANGGHLTLRLLRRHQDRCYLNSDRRQFTLIIGLSLGPIEHHLDVVYNLPQELRLSQPIDWRYGQVTIEVPRMNYEIALKQVANYNQLASWQWWAADNSRPASPQPKHQTLDGCPLEVSDVTYLPTLSNTFAAHPLNRDHSTGKSPQQQQEQQDESISITTSGLALNNQSQLQVERLFDDYTRPTVSHHLRQLLSFHLSSKTLPLAASSQS